MFQLNFKRITVCMACIAAALSAATGAHAAAPSGKVVLHYSGPYRIPATLIFERKGNRYNTASLIKVPFYPMLFRASGVVQGNALKPTQYTDTRRGKLYAQARFSDTSVTFGKAKNKAQTRKKQGPTFDAFSLTWHLALNGGVLPNGSFITNAKNIYPLSGIKKMADGTFMYNNKKIATRRYYVKRKGNKIEFTFAPSLNNIPVKVVYHNKGKVYTFRLTKVETMGNAMTMPAAKI